MSFQPFWHGPRVDQPTNGRTDYDTQLDATFCSIDNSRTRGHAYKSSKPHCTIDATKYVFSNRVISTWNNLPDMVVHSPTLSTFKHHFSVVDLSCHS